MAILESLVFHQLHYFDFNVHWVLSYDSLSLLFSFLMSQNVNNYVDRQNCACSVIVFIADL